MYIFKKRGKKETKKKNPISTSSFYYMTDAKPSAVISSKNPKGLGEKQLYIKCNVLIVISYKILIMLAFKITSFVCYFSWF